MSSTPHDHHLGDHVKPHAEPASDTPAASLDSQTAAEAVGAAPQAVGYAAYPNPQAGYAYAVPQPGVVYPMVYPYAPPVPVGPPPFARPDPHWGWVIGAFFCFWPIAIAACINAARVDSAWFQGDWYGAQRASVDAERFGKIGVWVGVGMIALSLILMIAYFIIIFRLIAGF